MTENIKFYLAFAYSDEQLAALLAHTESGKLGWLSCCCLMGIPTAPHPLQEAAPSWAKIRPAVPGSEHLNEARKLPFADAAETEFLHLGHDDAERRGRLIPLIKDEMQVREFRRYLRESVVEAEGVLA